MVSDRAGGGGALLLCIILMTVKWRVYPLLFRQFVYDFVIKMNYLIQIVG